MGSADGYITVYCCFYPTGDPGIPPAVRLIKRDNEHEPVITDILNDKLDVIGSESLNVNLDTLQLSSTPSLYCLEIQFAGKTITVQMKLSKTRAG